MATGRYAPSPTGTQHLGNLRTALAAWLTARSAGSAFRFRWEDLDDAASPEHEASQSADLEALGIDFDGPPLRQSQRTEAHVAALARLEAAELTYPCWCSRREVREAAAPHAPPGSYPGTCRDLGRAGRARRERAAARPPATRLRANAVEVTVNDRIHGPYTGLVDDIVLCRGDGTPAYNLAVVVDDAHQGIGEVVRGDDLLAHTPAHAHLHRLLGHREPAWCHVPLLIDRNGDRLAKRDGSLGRVEWQREETAAAPLLAELGRSLGIEVNHPVTAADLLPGFAVEQIPRFRWMVPGPGLALQAPPAERS